MYLLQLQEANRRTTHIVADTL